jgi:MoaA/NifB/PqqE/SkfB family radical SAM enzyme
MIKTQAIRLVHKEPMMITWDVGRRCNYDCSYCEASRHNNTSKHRTIEDMLSVFNFIKEYTKLYDCDSANINFTGGEPTSNPIFFDFAKQVKQQSNYGLGLTTNGAFSYKFIDTIEECFDWVTVSYHCEADSKLKERVLENIKELHTRKIRLSVNVMMHVDYWEESLSVCNILTEHGVKFNPRPIGDGNTTITGWFKDTDGSMRRTSHEYSTEQQQWYFKFMNLPVSTESSKQGTELGRNCCGGRCIQGKVDNQWTDVKLVDTNFKGWYCSVNKYFLHIDHETGLVYHHQTCQAKFNNTRGSIGNLSDTNEIFEYVTKNKNSTIVCPNNRCGCGMCVPKAKELSEYIKINY